MEIALEYAYIHASIGINLCVCIYLCFSDKIYQKHKTMQKHIFMLFIRNLDEKEIWFLKRHRETFFYIQMVVMTVKPSTLKII